MFNHSLQRRRAFARPLALLACTVAATTAVAAPAALPQRASVPNLPLTFEKNTGHWPREVQFVARSGGGTLFLTKREAVLDLRGKGKSAALRLKLAGSNPAAVVTGLDKQSSIVNYFLGNDPKQWRVNVPTYSRVKLAGVYPGVDLVYYGAAKSRTLEYDFVVKPGADPSRIRMAVSGAESLRTVGGRLIASTACGDVTLNRPYAYQTVAGVRRQVACSFTLERNTVAFQVARYDASRPLVVDPTLTYSTFVGGSGADSTAAYQEDLGIAVDATGAVYVTGTTGSSDFPTTVGAYDRVIGGTTDVSVTKINPAGTALVYSTYLGGAGADVGGSIAVNALGAAYIAGAAAAGFPSTAGAYDTTHNGGTTDVFVAALNPAGSTLTFSTFLGGDSSDYPQAIALDSGGNVVVAGQSSAATTVAFPTTTGAFQATAPGNTDGFIAKLASTGASLIFGTFLGGAGLDVIYDIVMEPTTDNIIATGLAGTSVAPQFPTTLGAYDRIWNGGNYDAFVAKLNADGTALIFSTFLGGTNDDRGTGIALDSSGNIYITGYCGAGFPTTIGAYDRTYSAVLDAFVTKLNSTATALVYSTYLGVSATDRGHSLAVDARERAWVVGYTSSDPFPTTADAYQQTFGGSYDGFVSAISASGAALDYSSYLGGPGLDSVCHLAIAGSNAYISGYGATGLPTSTGAFQTTQGGGTADLWVAKLDISAPSTLVVAPVTGQVGERIYITATLTSGGSGVSGATVRFTMPGGATIDRLTDASGIADYYWDIPVGQGSTTIGAAFAGDASYQLSSGSGALTVTVTSKVTVLPATGTAGQSTGIVAYLWDGKSMSGLTGKHLTLKIDGGAASNFPALTSGTYGKATYAYAIPAAMAGGAHSTTVDWAGGGGYPASQGTGTLNVTALANTYVWVHSHGASRNAATKLTCYLYDYRRNGDLIPVSGKSISFSVAGTTVGTATTDNSGKAFRNHTPASAGALTQTMSFAGDAAYAAASNTGTLTVTP
jgi:hypothetical protein